MMMHDHKMITESEKVTLCKLKVFLSLKQNPQYKPPPSIKRRDDVVDFVVTTLTRNNGVPVNAPQSESKTFKKPGSKVKFEYSFLCELVQSHGLEVLIYFAILCGCDYYKIDGCGPKKGLKILIDMFNDSQWRRELTRDQFIHLLVSITRKRLPNLTVSADDLFAGIFRAWIAFRHLVVFSPSRVASTSRAIICY